MAWEREGARDWALPGYGLDRPTSTEPAPVPNRTGPVSQGNLTLPKRPDFPSNSFPSGLKAKLNSVEGRPRSQSALSPSIRGPATFRAKGPYAQEDKPPQKGGTQLSIGKRRWQEGIRSDAIVRLPAGPIRRNYNSKEDPGFFNAAKSLSHIAGRERMLEIISEATGAFIQKGDPGDRLLIWGDPKQVAQARDALLKLIDEYHGSKTFNGQGPWSKVHPQYAEDVEQAGIEKAVKNAISALRVEPTTRDAHSKEMLFVWPREGPSPRQCLGDQLEKLDPIRKEFEAHIFLKGSSEDLISICGGEDIDMVQIAAQLRERWKAAVAKFDVRIKAYLVEPGDVITLQDKVLLLQTNGLSLPILCGNRAITDHAQHKAVDLDSVRAENDHELLRSFKKALSKAHFFAGLLRMRIHFGSLVIDTYRKASNGGDGYSLEEFRDMMLHEKASARLVSGLKLAGEDLISRCIGAGSLLTPLDSSYSLSDIKTMTPTYAACFEFSGIADSQLRLEVNFRQRALEIEQDRHRWFKTHKGNGGQAHKLPLQVGVVDFSRSDWQADIQLFEPVHSSEVRTNLAQFQRTVRFDDSIRAHSMTAVPRKKIIFDPEMPLASFTEKAFIQLRVQKTKYVLELARFDQYTRSRAAWSHAPIVSWSATLFDPDWDSMLGSELEGNGPKKPGKFTARFETLFPSYSRMGDDSDEQGFWEFFQIVDKIAGLLGAADIGSEGLSGDFKSRVATDLLDAELGMLF